MNLLNLFSLEVSKVILRVEISHIIKNTNWLIGILHY